MKQNDTCSLGCYVSHVDKIKEQSSKNKNINKER